MLAHVIDVWRGAGFAEVVVVLGKDAAFLRERSEEDVLRMSTSESGAGTGAGAPTRSPVRWVENTDWESGMFSSVRAGLAAALASEPPSSHVAVSPSDLPFLRRSSLRTVLEALTLPEAHGERTLVVPVCGRRRGHPLVVPRALAERVLGWAADARLNQLFAEPDVRVLHLEGFDETVLADVDRPADLASAGVPA